MLVGQNKEIDLAFGFANDVLDHFGHRVASVGGAENDSAINQDAIGIGARLARQRDQKTVPEAVPVHPDFRPEPTGGPRRPIVRGLVRVRGGRSWRSPSGRRLPRGRLYRNQRPVGLASRLALGPRRAFCCIRR